MRAAVNASPVHPLLPKLKELRLGGMLDSLEVRAAQAVQDSLSPGEFLALLLDDELERRGQRRLGVRLREAGCEETKTLARFDFAVAPSLNRSVVTELATCAFVARHENLLICGPTGVGKSHIANALAFEALRRGYRVIQRSTNHLLAELHASRADGSYARKMARLDLVDLLVLDDFGLRPLSAQGVDDLYEIINRRYERRSIVITSNRAMEEWAELFGDDLVASATLTVVLGERVGRVGAVGMLAANSAMHG
ncbi:MAG: ATP-binding protein [Chloroflexi bacterium]|nr:ATP-binding protein [Chloroflexota bacterium]